MTPAFPAQVDFTSRSSGREALTLFAVLAFAIAFKSNDALSNPQFWAEDAYVFFKEQFGQRELQLGPYSGYLLLIPRLVAWFGSWAAPVHAPLIYNGTAIALSAFAILLTCLRLRPYLPIWIVALSFLAVPTGGELFGTLTNVHWFLQFAMAAYCLAPDKDTLAPTLKWARAAGLLLIALTGPFSVLLSVVVIALLAAGSLSRLIGIHPFKGALQNFVARRDWRMLGALGIGALVQCYVMATHSPAHQQVVQPVLGTLYTTFADIVPAHIFGDNLLGSWVWMGLCALILGLLTFSPRIDGNARLIVLAFLALAALECYLPMLRMADLEQIRALNAADRYFYLIKVVWWWSVWLILSQGSSRRHLHATVVTTALACLVAFTQPQHLRRPPLVHLDWPAHAAALARPGLHTIPVNPSGWSITVDSSSQESNR